MEWYSTWFTNKATNLCFHPIWLVFHVQGMPHVLVKVLSVFTDLIAANQRKRWMRVIDCVIVPTFIMSHIFQWFMISYLSNKDVVPVRFAVSRSTHELSLIIKFRQSLQTSILQTFIVPIISAIWRWYNIHETYNQH